MGCFGTKTANDSVRNWAPETLGHLYRGVIDEVGLVQLNKPVPGDKYRKMYNPLSDIDRPSFRRMPGDIIITSPARLFRSHGYKYKGRVYLEANYYWEFEYKYVWGDGGCEWRFDWMPVRLLSYCYIYNTVTFERKPVQLKIFN